LYVAHVPPVRHLPPGYVVTYPNRDKATSKATKAVVTFILIASVVLMLAVTIGGWSKLQGLRPLNFVWCALYLGFAFYIARWARGLLPIATAFAILLLIISFIAATGAAGTSWFDRSHVDYASAQSLFGTSGLSPDLLGLLTWLIVPVQALLIVFAMRGFSQGWNVEVEKHVDELDR
jgi:nitric oxide reductase large subunit